MPCQLTVGRCIRLTEDLAQRTYAVVLKHLHILALGNPVFYSSILYVKDVVSNTAVFHSFIVIVNVPLLSYLITVRQNIDCLCEALKEFPQVECARPMGGPFCFMDVTNTGYDDKTFAKMLYDRGVNTSFGAGWGKEKGVNHIRLALANPPEYHRECVVAMVRALRDILQ